MTHENESDIVVRKLTSADVRSTAEVLADAFGDNPAYAWMHPRAATRASDLRAFFDRNLRWHLPLDLTWVACRGAQVVGTSTLEPPATLEECDRLVARDPAPVVLSTQRERNLPLYQRAGFVLQEDHQMGVRWGSRGFRTWFMTRERFTP